MELRIKDIVELKNIKTDDHAKPYIGLENIGSWNSRFIPTESVSEGINNEYSKDDILFGKLRPYLAKAYIAPNSGVCSTEFFVLHTKKGYYNKYLLYRLLTPVFIGYISSKVAGVKMPRTTWADFSSISFDIPSLSIQQRIVSYLDDKTTRIDRAVSLLQKKRDAYTRLKASIINHAVTRGLNPNVKLKDSGVDWIGMIPENWIIRRFKEVFSHYTTGFTPESKNAKNFEGQNTWITIADMTHKYVSESNLCLSDEAIQKAQQPITPKGSLLFSFKLSIGKVAFAGKDLYTNEAIVSLMPSSRYNLDFFYYYLPIVCFNNATENIYGAKMLNQKIISNMIFAVPPKEEQQAIASYLDTHCSRIDHAISIVDKQIDAYTRLKKSLINEVVTGKRKC